MPAPVLTITIVQLANGNIGVNAPMSTPQEKQQCYWMLFNAFMIIKDAKPSMVIPAQIIPPTNLKRGGQG